VTHRAGRLLARSALFLLAASAAALFAPVPAGRTRREETPQDRERAAAPRASSATEELVLQGRALRKQGKSEEARATLERALALARALGDGATEASALTGLALLAENEGEMQRVLTLYGQALDLSRRRGDRHGEARVLENLGTSLSLLGRLEESLQYLDQALGLWRSLGDRRGEASALYRKGWVRYLDGRPEEALADYESALTIGRQLGDRPAMAGALDRRSTAYVALGRFAAALAGYREALDLCRQMGDPLGAAHVEANLGRLYEEQGEAEAALAWSDRALAAFRRIGDRHAAAHALYVGARAERRRGNLEAALTRTREAIALLEEIRSGASAPSSRSALLAQRHRYYELGIELLMDLAGREPGRGREAEALHLAERARARTLLDLVGEPPAEIRRGVPARLLDRERALAERLNARERERTEILARGAAADEVAACEREIGALLLAEESLAAEIRRASPRYAALRPGRPLALPEIQAQLDEGTLLLVYALGEERSFLWAVDRLAFEAFALPRQQAVEEDAARFYRLLVESGQRRARGGLDEAGRVLSELLLGPIAGRLRGRRLLVVADGALHYVPFAALPLPVPESGTGEAAALAETGAGPVPLLRQHEVVYLPSASVLAALAARSRLAPRPQRELALLADPVFEREDRRLEGIGVSHAASPSPGLAAMEESLTDLERAAGDLGESRFRRLPASGREAQAIAALLPPGRSLAALGFAASRQRVLDGEFESYRILHFATHGVLNTRHPELSGVVLSLFDEQGRPQDGFLRVHDILGLRLSADLVVLSACRTALGKEVRGEGLVGLAQAFFAAGAPRVLVSLWGVRDRSTAELMARFHRAYLLEGKSPAAALRRAQLSMLGEEAWKAPYSWAGFTLQGTP
jgi:CHAT domain-containing protein/Tfp pilus assembly protein PilF